MDAPSAVQGCTEQWQKQVSQHGLEVDPREPDDLHRDYRDLQGVDSMHIPTEKS